MKTVVKLEALGLFILFSCAYFYLSHGSWGLYLGLFFVPDVAFLLYLITKKIGAIGYNVLHHQGIMAGIILLGYAWENEFVVQLGLIFMAHSFFDRVAGYGLKYLDDFDHTHLGWIGKSQHKNG